MRDSFFNKEGVQEDDSIAKVSNFLRNFVVEDLYRSFSSSRDAALTFDDFKSNLLGEYKNVENFFNNRQAIDSCNVWFHLAMYLYCIENTAVYQIKRRYSKHTILSQLDKNFSKCFDCEQVINRLKVVLQLSVFSTRLEQKVESSITNTIEYCCAIGEGNDEMECVSGSGHKK